MAKKVTQEDILNMNRIYLKYGTYSQTARETGFSPSTVKRYIQSNFVDPDTIKIKKFDSVIRPIKSVEVIWDLLTEDEQDEIEELWREISI